MNRILHLAAVAVLIGLSVGDLFGQPGTGQQGQVVPGSIAPQPWYDNSAVQGQLRISADQLKRLNQAYQQRWTDYRNQLNRLRPDERAQRIQELNTGFNSDFNSVAGSILDRRQMPRYNQLS